MAPRLGWTTYVEAFGSGWHAQRREHFVKDHFKSETHCGLTIVPRNVWHNHFEGALCVACQDRLNALARCPSDA